MSTNQKPIQTIRDGALKVAIWGNQSEDGKTFHSVTFGRTYTDDDGVAKSTSSMSGGDLLKVARLANKAYDAIAQIRAEQSD